MGLCLYTAARQSTFSCLRVICGLRYRIYVVVVAATAVI